MRLSEAVAGFLIARTADGYSSHTLAIYRHHLGQLSAYLSDPSHDAVTAQDVRRFFAWLREDYKPRRADGDTHPLAPATLSNAWCAIRSFYNWASSELGIDRPDTTLKQPRFQHPEISPLTQEEIAKLLQAAEYTATATTKGRKPFRMKRPTAARDVAIVLLLLDTGLRVSECARLQIGDVNMGSGEVFVKPYGSGRKTKSRHVYIGNVTKRAIWRYLATREGVKPDDSLFEGPGGAMDRNGIRLMLARLGKRAGVSGVHPHKLRHTFAIQFLRNGGDVFSLQRLLGHSTLDMVRKYLKLADADAATAHRKASPVDKWRLQKLGPMCCDHTGPRNRPTRRK